MTKTAIKERAVSLNVSLPVELENRVREHVASGMYGSASEVIREALRLFEAYQATQASQLQALRADVHQGLADVNAHRVSPLDIDVIKQKGRQRLKQAEK
jgi:antitoxin ParD1/3/4